jgi:hypothetical protein
MADTSLPNSPTPPLGGFGRLRERAFRRAAAAVPSAGRDATDLLVLPPLESRLAILSAQRNAWKLTCLTSLGLSALFGGGLLYMLNHKLFARMGSEFLVVPGAAEYVRVRPNLIPDEAVFAFAEFVATYAGTFTYRNARAHFATIAERMEPELKGQFLRDTDSRLPEWERRRVDQVFSFDPVRRLDVLNDKFGPKYALVVRGMRTQYADGTLLHESEENLYLVLRPRLSLRAGTRADESLFQIERLEWVTRAQAETLLATRVRDEKAGAPQ